jgi:AraC-like DNA-binding protein
LNPLCYFPQFVIDRPDLRRALREFHAAAEYETQSSDVVRLMDEIGAHLKALSLKSTPTMFNKEISCKIRLTKQFIEDHCSRDISLKEMSHIACLSMFHFNRFFHACYGLSPYAYYLVCKMKKSQKTILKQKSVLAATYDIGFFDQSHFTKLFKKHIGVTPGKYLRDNDTHNNLKVDTDDL